MRRFLIVPLAFAVLIACNSETKPSEEKKAEPTATATDDITKHPDYQKGNDLVWSSTSDCKTCHSINDKINGPAYRDVAAKYANGSDTVVAYLSKKIITGGSGVWGEIPMIPHPAISQADAEAMAKYILLLKK